MDEIPDPIEDAEAIVEAAYHGYFRELIRRFNETWDRQFNEPELGV